jgi:hypothetical protein
MWEVSRIIFDYIPPPPIGYKPQEMSHYAAFTLDVTSMLNENLGGILGGHPMLIGQ